MNKKNILIVEDDEFNKIVLQDMINIISQDLNIKPQTFVATNFWEAKNLLSKYFFDLALIDINLPGKNGVEVLKLIKSKKDIPCIAVTAYAISGDREKLLLLGFDDYISKPIEMGILKKILEKYLKSQR